MNNNEDAPTFKILLIGDSGTGKSSLLLRFCDDQFFGDEMSSTIGVDFKVKYIQLNAAHAASHADADASTDATSGTKIKLTIWDTAGQERFRTLTSSYYRGAQGVILVYDVNSRESYQHLQETWIPELETYSSSVNVVKMVVGNKIDLEGRQVSREEGQQFARDHGALFLECSAKTKIGVQQAFEELCLKIYETPDLWQKRTGSGRVELNQEQGDDAGFCPC
jgi:Ras-related protein Rab-18